MTAHRLGSWVVNSTEVGCTLEACKRVDCSNLAHNWVGKMGNWTGNKFPARGSRSLVPGNSCRKSESSSCPRSPRPPAASPLSP